MSYEQRLAAVLIGFARELAYGYELEEVLHRLGGRVLDVVPAAGAGISLGDADGQLHFVAATGRLSERLEAGQDELHEGPGHDAYETRQPTVASDLRQTDRWPRFRESAIAAGILAAAGIPLLTGDSHDACIGALSLYRSEARPFADDEIAAARVLADMATGCIVNVRDLERAQELARQLQHALDSRILVEQAKGFLAAQLSIAVDDAFDRLRGHARSRNRTLQGVAADLLAGKLGPDALR